MSRYVFDFQEINQEMLSTVGGKGANLGELSGIEGILVPGGFCIATNAFQKIIDEASIGELLDQLALLKVNDRSDIQALSDETRRAIKAIIIPDDIRTEVAEHLASFEKGNAYAVRSSATAEDLPTASFAGQQDTFLNVIGENQILTCISKCWASLFTERAVIYRIQNGFDHRKVQLAVVVQKMVFPQVAGILFTADPVTSGRKVVSIDASFGLGEAMVSGIVNADNYKVSHGKIIGKNISTKKRAIYPLKNGGTTEQHISPEKQNKQALTDLQILRLHDIGRKIEGYFGSPQDIEWCLADDIFYVVQSRPITTLFPIPKTNDADNHVYVSVGHNQMMTDALKPLGRSFFQLKVAGRMVEAGGRLFVDIAPLLSSPESSKRLIQTFGQSDVLIRDAIIAISRRKGFIKSSPESKAPNAGYIEKVLPWSYLAQFEDNQALVDDLIKDYQISMQELKRAIQEKSGADLFDFIEHDIAEMKRVLFTPQTWDVIKVAMYATFWVNRKMLKWLGEKNAADTVSQSVPNNVTSEMGLALLEVADVIRNYPEIIDYLQHVKDDNFLDRMEEFTGGKQSSDAIRAYLVQYGMRCAGEIDITKTRWAEKPAMLIPLILNNIRNFPPGAAAQKFEQGRQEALKKEQEILARLRQLPNGNRKARETKRMISLIRNLIGYREYPKYGMSSRYFVYKQAFMHEADQLVKANVIPEKEDVYYLTFEEFREVVSTRKLDDDRIARRKEEHKINEKLTPPRVMTSDGEIISSSYKMKNLPAEAIPGLPVSSGTIEGRARVILNMENADLEEGDILVTTFTDPSWTPLFVSIKGLVTEVGGLMTHGAVIAREYGLPAVVGVENATKLIQDGQRIRVNGTEGYVSIVTADF